MHAATRNYLYNSFNSLIAANGEKPLKTWLEIDLTQTIKRGEQAFVYLLHSVEHPRLKCVAKISRFISDYTLKNELNVLKRLEDAGIVNVPRAYGIFPAFINYKTGHISFRSRGPGYFPAEMLLMEYIHHSMHLAAFIEIASHEQILAALKQVLLTLAAAQHYARFTHYDLHTLNILIANNSIDKYATIKIADKDYQVAKCGVDVCIIDFGCSYADCADNTLGCSLVFTKFGFFIDRYDGGTLDCIRLLYRVIDECHIPGLKKIVRGAAPLELGISPRTGWIKHEVEHIPAKFFAIIAEQCAPSWFLASTSEWIDNLQIFLSCPLMIWDLEDEGCLLENSLEIFVNFMSEVENYTTDTKSLCYIMRVLCVAIARYLDDFLTPEMSLLAAQCIETDLQEKLTGLVDNLTLDINYMEIIPAIIQLARCYETFAAREMMKQFAEYERKITKYCKCRSALDFFHLLK